MTQVQGNAQTRTDLRAHRSATPTHMTPNQLQMPGYGFNPDPTFQHPQNAFQAFTPIVPQQQQHQHQHQLPPDYYDMMGGAGPGAGGGAGYPQPQASYGGVMGGYPMWNASQRAFSPLPNYGASTGSWYANGFGWGMR